MKIYHYLNKNGIRNFGDDLNLFMWDKLAPELLYKDPAALFVGVGTILNDNLPSAKKTVVFGSGFGYSKPPKIDKTWQIYCVRGPLTAKTLGLNMELAITDSGALINKIFDSKNKKKYKYSYMPHAIHAQYASLGWERICNFLKFGYIDPRKPVEDVLNAIDSTECLITEAMHGAIIADALRIPWIPIKTSDDMYEFKWNDWCSSVKVKYNPLKLLPLWGLDRNSCFRKRIKQSTKEVFNMIKLLNIVNKHKPILSSKNIFNELISKLEIKLSELRHDINEDII